MRIFLLVSFFALVSVIGCTDETPVAVPVPHQDPKPRYQEPPATQPVATAPLPPPPPVIAPSPGDTTHPSTHVEPSVPVLHNAPPKYETLFKVEQHDKIPNKCCICLSDNDTPATDISNPESTCAEWLKHQTSCDYTMVGPRHLIPGTWVWEPTILESEVAKLPAAGSCSEMTMFYEGHSGAWSLSDSQRSETWQFLRLAQVFGKLPKKSLSVKWGGCNVHHYPEAVGDSLQEMRKTFGIEVVEASGNQAYDLAYKVYSSGLDPGSKLDDMTPVDIHADDKGTKYHWMPCFPENTDCYTAPSHGEGGYHAGMSWRCNGFDLMAALSGHQKPMYQFCCATKPEKSDEEAEWRWTTPQAEKDPRPCKETHPMQE